MPNHDDPNLASPPLNQPHTRQQRERTHSFLLRLWPGPSTDERNDANWCASLQSVRTGERHMFANLESLLTYLCDLTHAPDDPRSEC